PGARDQRPDGRATPDERLRQDGFARPLRAGRRSCPPATRRSAAGLNTYVVAPRAAVIRRPVWRPAPMAASQPTHTVGPTPAACPATEPAQGGRSDVSHEPRGDIGKSGSRMKGRMRLATTAAVAALALIGAGPVSADPKANGF